MRHRKKTINKLGRPTGQREALLASLVCNLIEVGRIKTTLPKAKAARRMADKMVTLGKKNTLAARRLAASRLRRKDAVKELFDNVAPAFSDRAGGYTRIMKLGKRVSDSSEMALLEWVNHVPKAPKAEKPAKAEEPAAATEAAAGEKKPRTRKKKAEAAAE